MAYHVHSTAASGAGLSLGDAAGAACRCASKNCIDETVGVHGWRRRGAAAAGPARAARGCRVGKVLDANTFATRLPAGRAV